MVDDRRLTIRYWPLEKILPYAANARTHPEAQLLQLVESMSKFGFTQPVLVDANGVLIAGHGRILAAQKLGLSEAPVVQLGHLSEAEARAYRLADNRIALNSEWDEELLAQELEAVAALFDLGGLGFDAAELDRMLASATASAAGDQPAAEGEAKEAAAKAAGSLAEKFGVPPFSVLRAAEGWWQKRKAYWMEIGIQSELGRGLGNHAAPGGSLMPGVDRKTGKIVRTDSHARPVAA